jgi:hypothetical protein
MFNLGKVTIMKCHYMYKNVVAVAVMMEAQN